MPDAFSIRSALQGVLHDFADSSGFQCVETENLIRDIVSLLASYREEDIPLFPDVYVLKDPAGLRTLAPGAGSHKIGSVRYGREAAGKILKNTAGLAGGGWAVYAGKADNCEFEYGVFRSQRHSFATSAEESMCDLGGDSPIVVVRNRGHLTVELLNSRGTPFTVSLTASPPASSAFSVHIEELVKEASAALTPDESEQFTTYLSRLLTGLLQKCHGTLIAVIESSIETVPEEMVDGVWLSPPVDLSGHHARAVTSGDAGSLADLQAAESLLEGMVGSDGIVVLDTKGTIRAFRVFLAPSPDERAELDDRGGGRRRTFSLMKLRAERSLLRAAFIRSQDGETDCQRTTHA